MYELSDDDDSFTDPEVVEKHEDPIMISSDDETDNKVLNDSAVLSSDDELPEVVIKQKTEAIKKSFPTNNPTRNVKKNLFTGNDKMNDVAIPPLEKPKIECSFMFIGVNVKLPVKPYTSQVALMAKIMKGMKESTNCILESPTGSGKTLALLCSVLAWQQYEKNRIAQEQAKNESQAYFKQYPELDQTDVKEFIASPPTKKTDATPEKLFEKTNFGEKSIYQKPEDNGEPSTSYKRASPYVEMEWMEEDPPTDGLVSIHKKRRQGSIDPEDIPGANVLKLPTTPEKPKQVEDKGTPEYVRKLYDLVVNLRLRTSMIVDCRLPTIYYGARTHTQLQQVIKEFKRTAYCGMATMSVLSSRDKSCIREFSRDQWKSRNDMCRACVKTLSSLKENKNASDSNCQYYDNRRNLTHATLPPAFDLEDLVAVGEKTKACPFYGAREMAKTADIVFCPYNYLIDPSIRNSMKICLEGNVVVIDEAHNIESICRDAASLSFTHTQIQDSLKELEKVAEYRFQNQDILSYVDELVLTLRHWNDWFQHQLPFVSDKALADNKAIYTWEANHFVQSLENHNIGYNQYNSFVNWCSVFCQRLRDDPRTLLGVTQATGALLESIAQVLGYLFRDACQHMDDYTPVLERRVYGDNGLSSNDSWRKSVFNQWIKTDVLTLNLYCMNPAIVMQDLQVARSIVLASGTLTPMGNIHAELGTQFPIQVSPNHVISDERVWIGVVTGDSQGPQEYTSRATRGPFAAERFGKLIARVCTLTPHGVLCFITSYAMLDTFKNIWKATGIWKELQELKYVFCEQRNSTDHEDMMKDFYDRVVTNKGALLFAVYRGKVSEGMDFKDDQARAVICMGIPYPNSFDIAVKSKMQYNSKYKSRGLLAESEWLRVQAFRALNQAVGRCVRHKNDWGAVLLVDARYTKPYYTEHLSKWVQRILGNNHHTYESLQSSIDGLAAFMNRMKITEEAESLT